MPFLRAGFNPRSHYTGVFAWTYHVGDRKRKWALSELRRHANGDYFWRGVDVSFWDWGELCVFGSRPEFELLWCWQHGLAQSDLQTRREEKQYYPTPETLDEAMADG